MKKNILNLGRVLSRSDQRNIKAGTDTGLQAHGSQEAGGGCVFTNQCVVGGDGSVGGNCSPGLTCYRNLDCYKFGIYETYCK